MGKIIEKKQEKRKRLLETAFNLFMSKGVQETTIRDIVEEAGVAKGTFYLYFKDKYELIENLRKRKAIKLFEDAISYSRKNEYLDFTDQLLAIIDYIIDELTVNPDLLKFIYKNLSSGIQNINLEHELVTDANLSIYEIFRKRAEEDHLVLEDPTITCYMIIDLVSSTCYSSILYNNPLPIAAYKPHLYAAIKKLLKC